jgi:hypothetical protein
LVVGGGKPQAKSQYTKMLDPLKRARPEPKEDARKYKDLFYEVYDTELQGTELLNPKLRLGTDQRPWEKILGFINLRLVAKQADYAWEDRSPK